MPEWWFTAEHEQWLLLRYPATPEDNRAPWEKAIAEARARNPKIEELMSKRDSFSPEAYSELLWPLVWEELGYTGGAPVAAAALSEDEIPESLPPLPGGRTLMTYTYARLHSAVKRFDRGATVEDVAKTGLSQDDARRIRLLHERGFLRLAGGKLVPSARVGRKGARYALRYLDPSGTRWLDPNRELVSR